MKEHRSYSDWNRESKVQIHNGDVLSQDERFTRVVSESSIIPINTWVHPAPDS